MVKVENLCFKYKGAAENVIDGLSFEVHPGEAMAFIGPNGTGKSTTLSMLAGVLKPDSGTITKPKHFGYVPQGTGLFDDMTVIDNLKFFYSLTNTPVPKRLPLGLEPHRYKTISQLSGGLAKRVSIACALAGNPELVIFDEPCTGLDIISRNTMQRIILQLKKHGTAVIYACHEASEFEPFYDSLLFMGRKPYRKYSRDEMGDLSRTYIELFKNEDF